MIIKLLSGFATGNLLLMMILAGSAIDAPAQIIRGMVIDGETGGAVGFASVFFSGTTVGTVTDENGKFELEISLHPSMPLTVSAIGYSSVTLEGISRSEPLRAYLTPMIYDIPAIDISAKSLEKEREANLKIFRNQFLGMTSYSTRCKILNEEDITFNYGSDTVTLKAFALKPLQIHNKALGYIITYYLENFEYHRGPKNVLYTGKFMFADDESGRISGSLNEIRRNDVYRGSIMHFFSSLWANDLKNHGFTVYDFAGNSLSYEDIVTSECGEKYLEYKENLIVNYFGHNWAGKVRSTRNYLTLLKNRVSFQECGYFDPVGIMLGGEMGKQRVSEMLPIGFVPK
jgi:hypothetical protein